MCIYSLTIYFCLSSFTFILWHFDYNKLCMCRAENSRIATHERHLRHIRYISSCQTQAKRAIEGKSRSLFC